MILPAREEQHRALDVRETTRRRRHPLEQRQARLPTASRSTSGPRPPWRCPSRFPERARCRSRSGRGAASRKVSSGGSASKGFTTTTPPPPPYGSRRADMRRPRHQRPTDATLSHRWEMPEKAVSAAPEIVRPACRGTMSSIEVPWPGRRGRSTVNPALAMASARGLVDRGAREPVQHQHTVGSALVSERLGPGHDRCRHLRHATAKSPSGSVGGPWPGWNEAMGRGAGRRYRDRADLTGTPGPTTAARAETGTDSGTRSAPGMTTYAFLSDKWLSEARKIRDEYGAGGAPIVPGDEDEPGHHRGALREVNRRPRELHGRVDRGGARTPPACGSTGAPRLPHGQGHPRIEKGP